MAFCVSLLVFQTATSILMSRLSQEIIYDLRLNMTQRILDCPLQHLETVGAPKLLATLTAELMRSPMLLAQSQD